MRRPTACLVVMLVWLVAAPRAGAQQDERGYAGAAGGIATLSADAKTSTQPGRAEVSLYKPENGPALNLFAGLLVHRFVTIQANYVWNRNDVTLFSAVAAADGGGFDEEHRASAQHAVVGDVLLYFRARGEAIRPYLSAGAGVVRFVSPAPSAVNSGGATGDGTIASTHTALRVAVGIDLAMGEAWSFRYSFSETIGANPISPHLVPAGERGLANFQNLFGVLRRF